MAVMSGSLLCQSTECPAGMPKINVIERWAGDRDGGDRNPGAVECRQHRWYRARRVVRTGSQDRAVEACLAQAAEARERGGRPLAGIRFAQLDIDGVAAKLRLQLIRGALRHQPTLIHDREPAS